MKKNYYFSHSELRSKSKKSRDKNSSSRIEEEFIDNFSKMAITSQTRKCMREHSTVYELIFNIIENINIDFVYLSSIVNRI